jgi:hypothetical protein
MNVLHFDTRLPIETHRAACTSLGASTARRLASALTLHTAVHHYGQLETGTSYSVTVHRSLLTDFSQPISTVWTPSTPRGTCSVLPCVAWDLAYRVTDSVYYSWFSFDITFCSWLSFHITFSFDIPHHVCARIGSRKRACSPSQSSSLGRKGRDL